jgi:hypothetical protein
LPRSATSASRMLAFLMPAEVSSNLMALRVTLGREGRTRRQEREPRPAQGRAQTL